MPFKLSSYLLQLQHIFLKNTIKGAHNRRWILFCNTYEQHYSLYSLMEKNDNHIIEQTNLSAFPIWQQLLRTYFQWHKYYYHFFYQTSLVMHKRVHISTMYVMLGGYRYMFLIEKNDTHANIQMILYYIIFYQKRAL